MQKITASIITIGDELLIGQVIDTNSAWMAQELNKIGVWVQHRIAVGDVWNDIWSALDEEGKRSDIILITGGLGPTADDITKPLLCNYFNGKMIIDQPTLDHVSYLFEHVFKRPMPLLERNRQQAEVPDTCTVLKNERGTAPGMLFEKDKKIFVSLPGVPHEMKGLITDHVLPQLAKRFQLQDISHRTLLTVGVGESFLAEMIKEFETGLPDHIKLAYLPNNSLVRLRLTGWGDKEKLEKELDHFFMQLKDLVKEYMVIDEDISMEAFIGRLLKANNNTVSTAESCTGGYISHLLTSIPGSSSYFAGGVVGYDNSVKKNVLGVSEETLQNAGAVSEETVIQMVKGALRLMKTDYAIAVSGIMGPDGGTVEKPVGTVWIAVSNDMDTETKKFSFRFERRRNVELTVINALNLLRLFILKQRNK